LRYFADLHLHSYYSRATSKQLNLEHLNKWGQIKGLNVIATGDITHPKWLAEMREKLEESEPGLYRLKKEYRQTTQAEVPGACQSDIHFILSGEISTIYKKNDRVRKVHSVVFMPSLDAVEKFQTTLDRIGNIHSDGRPILGLDTRDLLEITLETDPLAQFIPAHIWTPWFSIFGSKSGFDSLEECFEDLTPHIFALETGLSSDPLMNWRLSALDPYTLVSNSDAHSPAKLAREANLFQTEMSYPALFEALKNKESDDFWGTIEFFPEEGKYHMDGHRKCNSMTRPSETVQNNGICPVCGKPAVLGVSYRIEELADRAENVRPENVKPFKSLIPLPEVMSEVIGVGPNSKRVQHAYFKILNDLGSELDILMNLELSDIGRAAGSMLEEAIRRMRSGNINPQPGYDGEYGVIRVFKPGERDKLLQQEELFTLPEPPPKKESSRGKEKTIPLKKIVEKVKDEEADYGLNDEQRAAVEHRGAPLIIQAGPGTGKTRTLTHRLASLIDSGAAPAEAMLAITFTNKAALEMRERLNHLIGEKNCAAMTVQTFHAFGAAILREQEYFFERDSDFYIFSPDEESSFFKRFAETFGEKITRTDLDRISILKSQGNTPDSTPQAVVAEMPQNTLTLFALYEKWLVEENAVDFDDLIVLPFRLLSSEPELRRRYLLRYPIIAVDEFQDINKTQYELFRLFAISAKDVCVIGDPDQAIYGFRGASPKFFTQFNKDFKNSKSIQLTRNYRSAQNILTASLQVLQSTRVDEKSLWSNIAPDVKIHLQDAPTDRAEAEFVVHKIEQHLGGATFFSMDSDRVDERGLPEDFSFSDFAILLRSRRLAPPIIEALSRSGIPFQNIDDDILMNKPFARFLVAAVRCWISGRRDLLAALVKNYLPAAQAQEFLKLYNNLPEDYELAELLSWLGTFAGEDDAHEAAQLVARFREMAHVFGDRREHFLDALMLQRQVDQLDARGERINVMTMHAAKGLEFPIVFVIGCEEEIIPFYRPGQKQDVAEERRLLYVGMTRAEKHLYITHAKKRFLFGAEKSQQPSRFLSGISQSVMQRENRHVIKKKPINQLKLF
jgi:DNA helicase II / ATP-dependent DNA helicase PcrA